MADEPNNSTEIVRLSDLPLNNGVLAPANFAGVFRLGQLFFSTGMVPAGVKTPEQAAIVVAAGLEIGLSPMQSIQNIMIIGNKPAVWGDAALALCSTHKDFEDCDESDDGSTATCTVTRKGRKPVVRSFSIDDAKKAGLSGKDIWVKYPARMRQMRARSYALRDSFPDVLKGVAIREEVDDIETTPATPPVPRVQQAKDVLAKKSTKKAKDEPVIEAEVVETPAAEPVVETPAEPEPVVEEPDTNDEADIVEPDGDEDRQQPEPEPKKEAEPEQTPLQKRLRAMKEHVCTTFGYEPDEGKKVVIAFLSAHERKPAELEDETVANNMLALLKKKNKTQLQAFLRKYAE